MSQPPRIISIAPMDRSSPAKDFILITGWVLDGVLDPIKVQRAFSRLVDIWPILSARMRKRPDGSWEYQIPTEFTATRPKYIFKCVPKPGLLTQAYPYPKPSTKIVAHWIDPNEHVDLFSEGGPRSVKDYLEKDIPLLQLQLTTFEDASILGLTFPHVLCDAHGIKHIALALSRLLKGEEILPMKEGDPFKRYMHNNNDNNKEKSPPKAPPNYKVLGIAQTVVLIICMIWNYLWTLNANAQSRLFYIPAADVKRLKAEAMADLKRERPDDKDAWVSTSDTIGAFFIKNAHISSTSKKRLSVSIVVNLRNYLPNVVPSPYLHNAVASVIVAPTPIAEVAKKSLGEIAYLIRQSLRAGTHRDAAEGWVRWTLANLGKPMVFFDSTGKYNVITNWREMKLMDIDFSGGLSSSSSDSKGQKVNCVYGYANSFQPWSVTDSFALFHDDPRGGMWAGGYLPKSVWENPKGFGQYETAK